MAKVTVGHAEEYGGKIGIVGKDFPTDFSNDDSARFNPLGKLKKGNNRRRNRK